MVFGKSFQSDDPSAPRSDQHHPLSLKFQYYIEPTSDKNTHKIKQRNYFFKLNAKFSNYNYEKHMGELLIKFLRVKGLNL